MSKNEVDQLLNTVLDTIAEEIGDIPNDFNIDEDIYIMILQAVGEIIDNHRG